MSEVSESGSVKREDSQPLGLEVNLKSETSEEAVGQRKKLAKKFKDVASDPQVIRHAQELKVVHERQELTGKFKKEAQEARERRSERTKENERIVHLHEVLGIPEDASVEDIKNALEKYEGDDETVVDVYHEIFLDKDLNVKDVDQITSKIEEIFGVKKEELSGGNLPVKDVQETDPEIRKTDTELVAEPQVEIKEVRKKNLKDLFKFLMTKKAMEYDGKNFTGKELVVEIKKIMKELHGKRGTLNQLKEIVNTATESLPEQRNVRALVRKLLLKRENLKKVIKNESPSAVESVEPAGIEPAPENNDDESKLKAAKEEVESAFNEPLEDSTSKQEPEGSNFIDDLTQEDEEETDNTNWEQLKGLISEPIKLAKATPEAAKEFDEAIPLSLLWLWTGGKLWAKMRGTQLENTEKIKQVKESFEKFWSTAGNKAKLWWEKNATWKFWEWFYSTPYPENEDEEDGVEEEVLEVKQKIDANDPNVKKAVRVARDQKNNKAEKLSIEEVRQKDKEKPESLALLKARKKVIEGLIAEATRNDNEASKLIKLNKELDGVDEQINEAETLLEEKAEEALVDTNPEMSAEKKTILNNKENKEKEPEILPKIIINSEARKFTFSKDFKSELEEMGYNWRTARYREEGGLIGFAGPRKKPELVIEPLLGDPKKTGRKIIVLDQEEIERINNGGSLRGPNKLGEGKPAKKTRRG